jgi:hypothetical protein
MARDRAPLSEKLDLAILERHLAIGCVNGKLNGRISPLLTSATDALKMRKPSVKAALEFIVQAQQAIAQLQETINQERT